MFSGTRKDNHFFRHYRCTLRPRMGGGQVKDCDFDTERPQGSHGEVRAAPQFLAKLRSGAREEDRTRFAHVLDDAADFLERHGELPDAVRWLRKEARAWRSAMR